MPSSVITTDEIDSMLDHHTMKDSLSKYVNDKIHQEVRRRRWSHIIIRGQYRRDTAVQLSAFEKRGKRFNWHRPTSHVVDSNTLEINCFPGRDYVTHNALLIATFLRLDEIHNLRSNSSTETVVEYAIPSPKDCMELFMKSNLHHMGKVDVVAFGYVENVSPKASAPWETGTTNLDQLFAWQKHSLSDGRVISYLGCMISLWGDIVESLIKALKSLNDVQSVIHLGKSGSLQDDVLLPDACQIQPNQVLVTGASSCMGKENIHWENILCSITQRKPRVMVFEGRNVTVSSPLVENMVWFEQWRAEAKWVDCEVFHAAKACQEESISFGYLHLISDTLACYNPENLSNERDSLALMHRQRAFEEIKDILLHSLAR